MRTFRPLHSPDITQTIALQYPVKYRHFTHSIAHKARIAPKFGDAIFEN